MGSETPLLCFSVYASAEENFMFLRRRLELVRSSKYFHPPQKNKVVIKHSCSG